MIANELLDNLPFGIARFTRLQVAGRCASGSTPQARSSRSSFRVACRRDRARSRHRDSRRPSATGPIPRGLDDWLRRAAATLRRGYVVLIDTMDTAAGMLHTRPDGWLRTYRGHAVGGPALVDPGSRDLVADVVIEQLRHAAADAGFAVLAETTQSAWLEELGIAAMVDRGRTLWEERAAIGDLAALEARSVATQAAALTDPTGLGSHRVVVLGRHLTHGGKAGRALGLYRFAPHGDGGRNMSEALEALLQEGRTFPPSEAFRKQALVTGTELYDDADRDWQGFWARQALALDWEQEWTTILDWDLPFAKWFVGGRLNVSYNCLDRHVAAGHGDQVAFYWEGEPGDTRVLTYADMLAETCRVANALKSLGVTKGDRVADLPRHGSRARDHDARVRASAPRTRSSSAASPRSR